MGNKWCIYTLDRDDKCGIVTEKGKCSSWLYNCSGSSKLTGHARFCCAKWSQANAMEGALGWHTFSSYKSSGSSSSSPSGKYVGNGRFLQKSLYTGSLESLIWEEKVKTLLISATNYFVIVCFIIHNQNCSYIF